MTRTRWVSCGFVLVAVWALCALPASAATIYYSEVFRADWEVLGADADTRGRYESTSPITNPWMTPSGSVIESPSPLGDGWSGSILGGIHYEHLFEPLSGSVVSEIIGATLDIAVFDADHGWNLSAVFVDGGFLDVGIFQAFTLLGGDITGSISIADQNVQVSVYGLLPFRVGVSALRVEYTAGGATGSSGQPTIPEPRAAGVFAIGVLVVSGAALRRTRLAVPART